MGCKNDKNWVITLKRSEASYKDERSTTSRKT